MAIDVYKPSVSHEYKVISYFKVFRSCFIKCQSSFTYDVEHGTMGLGIFSVRELKTCVGLFRPATVGLPFKLFGFKT